MIINFYFASVNIIFNEKVEPQNIISKDLEKLQREHIELRHIKVIGITVNGIIQSHNRTYNEIGIKNGDIITVNCDNYLTNKSIASPMQMNPNHPASGSKISDCGRNNGSFLPLPVYGNKTQNINDDFLFSEMTNNNTLSSVKTDNALSIFSMSNYPGRCTTLTNNKGLLCTGKLSINGGHYEGQIVDEKANGHGTLKWNNGDLYDGEFRENKRHGKGYYIWDNGNNEYLGFWEYDKRNGMGKYKFNGNLYEGTFKDDKISGQGSCKYLNGDYYIGAWENDKLNGLGYYKWQSSGNVYNGEWKDSVREGKGTYTWNNGECYYGDWKNGKRSGIGVLIKSNGTQIKGKWDNNIYIGTGNL